MGIHSTLEMRENRQAHFKGETTMGENSLSTAAQIVAAVGTVSVAILAIWGDRVRAWLVGPNLQVRLRSQRGNLTATQDGTQTVYYHLTVDNSRTWSPAHNVVVRMSKLETRDADRKFQPERLVQWLQFTWSHPQFHEISPTVTDHDMCDFGYLVEGSDGFVPTTYVRPINFAGIVHANESKRFTIQTTADNYHSKNPLVIEVTWDGTWTADTEELMKHLVVSEV